MMTGAGPWPPTHSGRRRPILASSTRSLWSLLILLVAVAAGCGSSATTAVTERQASDLVETAPPPTAAEDRSATEATEAAPTAAEVAPTPTSRPHPIAVADTELPPAPVGFDSLFDNAPSRPQPISIEIENINVANATVIAVGVNEDLSFEVPPADQVGWYEFGSVPGERGSAVLAAHIAYDGVDGVFRYLEDVEIGSIVVIGFDDGTTQRYRIEEVTEYIKEELPASLFDRTGDSQLALITCGGTFNYQLDSYESNTVAIAVPVL